MRSAAFILLAFASLGVAGYALWAYTLRPVGSTVHPEMMATYAVESIGILAHIFASAITLLLGPWQFVPAIRRRWPALHRWMGRAFLALGVLPGGLAGLYMAFHAYGGWVSTSGFALLAILWLFTAARAYQTARARDFAAHRRWMVRCFALALAALTLRIQLGLCAALGLAFDSYYPILAWISWIPNLIIAELLLRPRTSCKQTGAPAVPPGPLASATDRPQGAG